MQFLERGPHIDGGEIEAIEAEWGSALPSAYREFLNSCNGGIPERDIVDVPGAPGTPTDVQVFFGLRRPEKTSNLSWNLALLRERCASRDLLPIACDSGGNLFCIERRTDASSSHIVYCDLDASIPKTYTVATDFDEFVARLRSDI
jgi:hypothetical protein